MDKILLISYETDMTNSNAQLFKKTLENHNWEYIFIGNGNQWKGFSDKIIGYYDYLLTLDTNKIVILSDARDVFCLRSSDLLIDKIKDIIDTKIIISAEMFLIGHMNWSQQQKNDCLIKDPHFFWQGNTLDNYWQFLNKMDNLPIRKYINSGLIIGKVNNLLTAFEWLIKNNFNDDQLGFCEYTNKFPQNIYLDYNAELIHTTTCFVNGSLYNHNIQKEDSPTLVELLGLSSYFLHIPGISMSKGQKEIYNIIYTLFNDNIINENSDMFTLYKLTNRTTNNIHFITNDI